MIAHKRRLRRSGFALLIVILGIALVAACGHRRHKTLTDEQVQKRATDMTEWVLDDIDANSKQRAAIQQEVNGLVPQFNQLRKIKTPLREQMVAELLKPKPNSDTLKAITTDAQAQITPFVHEVLDAALRSHAVLDAKQRGQIADEWESRSGHHRGDKSWLIDAGTNRFLDKIEATDAQSAYVLEQKDLLSAQASALMTSHAKTRTLFIEQMRSDKPAAKSLHGQVDASSARFLAFVHDVSDAVTGLAETLSPEQRQKIQEFAAKHKR